ncbi:MAG TPA: M14 family zinc carboxypeptidase [Bacteroidales bacterium]|nr:M14 family zinc carboxypeptidase [Bacteroidales bacterium]
MNTIRKLLIFTLLAITGSSGIKGQQPEYLLKGTNYMSEIPAPSSYLGFEIGERHASHDQIVGYFTLLSQKSDRVKYEIYGRTHEGRPLTVAIISSPENIRNIEEIRRKHLMICDPSTSGDMNPAEQPVVVWLSHSIHGNEASGANSSMLTAYHFAAGTGKDIEDILKTTIILIDPCTNPDGMQRFSGWVNSHRSYQTNADPLSREHLEVWPGGRSNHYWFDLNRDWLPVEQPESSNRIKKLMEWKPNVLVDLHEMGSNSTFHFSPGEPKRVNPLIPEENQNLTRRLAEGYAMAFDKIGSLYFSAEQFDDFYIGRGPTYMDMNGGVSLLFEQASARGIAQTTENGLLTFQFAIRNQLTGAISTISTASRFRIEFLTYQKNYYLTALKDAKKSIRKAFVFGNESDRNTTYKLAEMLGTHGIKSYLLGKDIIVGKKTFRATNAYVVPLEQPQYRLIESIFETRTSFQDSIFYDVSAWNMPMAYNLYYEALDAKLFTADRLGEEFSSALKPKGRVSGEGDAYAYAIKWSDYNAPAALYSLLDNNIIVKMATSPIEQLNGEKLERGTLIIPMGSINQDVRMVETIVNKITEEFGIDIIRLSTGDNRKFDLGSPTLTALQKPRIVILSEEGVSGFSAGQLWHQFDTRYDIPVTILPVRQLATVNLYKYNVLIIPDGTYQIDERTIEKIRAWTGSGNTLIGMERASQWLAKNKFIESELHTDDNNLNADTYEGTLLYSASREVPGTIYDAVLDPTHPLNFGFTGDHVPIYKDNKIVDTGKNLSPLNYPVRFSAKPLLSGYSPRGFEKTIEGTPVAAIFPSKQGRIIAFYNNPVFRGYWRGLNRYLANAVFFSKAVKFSAGGEGGEE